MRAHLHVVGIAVYVFDINQLSLPTPFYSVLVSISVIRALPKTLCFLTLFFWSYFCLKGPFNYMSLYESLPQP